MRTEHTIKAVESPVKVVYFIGIGGIGMSALARYFHAHGRKVSGYDRTETGLTRELVKEGIVIHYSDDPASIPELVDLVVYTPAIPSSLRELQICKERGYRMMKRSEVLGMITGESFSIAVAGTHGKTTISTMIAHMLRQTGYGCNAFLGGISVNYNTNYWGDAGNVCVVEADEYDRSFLHLHPDVAVISAMDPDHLDIYGTSDAVEEAFIEFSGKVKTGGLLVHKHELGKAGKLKGEVRLTYSIKDAKASTYVSALQVKDGYYVFDVHMGEACFKDVELHMGGIHNVENIAAAITVAHHLGIKEQLIKEAVASFRGVKRRFEYVIPPLMRNDGWIMIDDYAHHPEELKALLVSIRGLFPNKKCTLVFQPHLYTRTRDFADEFAEVLDSVDKVILLPIYPARELPIEGVNSEMLMSRMKNKNVFLLDKKALLDWIRAEDKKDMLLVTAGAGDIDTVPKQVMEWLQLKEHAAV